MDTVLVTNRATDQGGGIIVALAINNTGSKFVNCIITGNSAGVGGGLFVIDASVDLINSTVFANTATDFSFGAGVSAHGTGLHLHVFNSIFSNNTAMGNAMDDLAQITTVMIPGFVMMDHCCVQNLSSAFDFAGDNNTRDSPMFVDLEGQDGVPGTGDEDLHLRAGSACVDAGSNDLAEVGIVFDFDGLLRFVDDPDTVDTGVGNGAIVDIGAFERQPGLGQPIPTVSFWGVLFLVLSLLVAGSIVFRNCGQSPVPEVI